jgi:uncharacterized protein YukE
MKKKELKRRLRKLEKLSAKIITDRNFRINRLKEDLKKEIDAKKSLARWYADVSKMNNQLNEKMDQLSSDIEAAVNKFTDKDQGAKSYDFLKEAYENPRF